MSTIVLYTAKGAPGATTDAMLIAALWPRRTLLIDCDPAGGDIALRLPAADGSAMDVSTGMLSRDPALSPPPQPAPPADEVGDLIEQTDTVEETPTVGQGIAVTLQYDSPTASSVANTESALRGIAGVRSAGTTSLALGDVSLMRVTFDGDPAALRSALEARGYQVIGSGTTLRIRRAPQLLPPDIPVDTAPSE